MFQLRPDPDEFGEFGVPAHVIHKGGREQVRFYVNEYQGHEYMDIRAFYRSEEGWRPSRKGVTLRPEFYRELLKGVLELGGQVGEISQTTLDAIIKELDSDHEST